MLPSDLGVKSFSWLVRERNCALKVDVQAVVPCCSVRPFENSCREALELDEGTEHERTNSKEVKLPYPQ